MLLVSQEIVNALQRLQNEYEEMNLEMERDHDEMKQLKEKIAILGKEISENSERLNRIKK